MAECVDSIRKISNKDLLGVENNGCADTDVSKLLLITKKAQKNAIKRPTFKTERISSSILNRAKMFLDKTKVENPDNNCDIDINSDKVENEENDDSRTKLEMNLLVFERENNSDSSDDSSDSSHSQSEYSDSDSDDGSTSETHKSDKNIDDTNNNNINGEH